MIGYLNHTLKHGTEVSFHTLAAETMAKVRLLENELIKPGETGWAQFVLEKPLAVIKGDRYIIRSPMETLGGGIIVDAHPKRLKRFKPEILANLKARMSDTVGEAVIALLENKQPLEITTISAQVNITKEGALAAIETLVEEGRIIALGEGERRLYFTSSGWQKIVTQTTSALTEYHKKYPVRPGMPRVELMTRLKLGNYINQAVEYMSKQGVIAEAGANIKLPGHKTQLTAEQLAKIDAFIKSLESNPFSPPGDFIPEPDLVTMLIEQGRVVRVSDGIIYTAAAYQEMKEKITLAEVRDMFQPSRKYAQALLEYLDREKVTRRVEDDRVLY
jgi:selenocysteine-specific elongation factor